MGADIWRCWYVGNVIRTEMEFNSNSSQVQPKVEAAMKKILDGTKGCSVCKAETYSASSKHSSGSKKPTSTKTVAGK